VTPTWQDRLRAGPVTGNRGRVVLPADTADARPYDLVAAGVDAEFGLPRCPQRVDSSSRSVTYARASCRLSAGLSMT
jgi:hypothetical protein